MDSGNSGSLQSSSGGDEEYDSRAVGSVSAFMSGGSGSIPNPPPFYDPLSTYLQQNPNSSLLNSSLSWPRVPAQSLRSDPNPINHEIVHSMLPNTPPFMPCFQPNSGGGAAAAAAPPMNQHQAAARNPKKRSRASRRAPTTVLTTDTTNFRAMVQEFTGIPAPPFNSSAFQRSRLDLFGSRSAAIDGAAQPPPYLRRPFAQKVQSPHPFLSSSTALDAAIASNSPTTNNNNNNTAAASSSTPSINYQLPITQGSNLFNIPNQNLLASLLQSNPKFPFSTPNSPIITSKPQNSFQIEPNNHHQTKIGDLRNQFSLEHNNHISETLAGLPNLIPSDHNNNDDAGTSISAARYGFEMNTMSGKMSFSGSSTSECHGGKAAESGARGEGMESWICSSD